MKVQAEMQHRACVTGSMFLQQLGAIRLYNLPKQRSLGLELDLQEAFTCSQQPKSRCSLILRICFHSSSLVSRRNRHDPSFGIDPWL